MPVEDNLERTHDVWLAQQRLLRQFEEAWRQQQRPTIDSYLPAGNAEEHALLLELVHIDLEYRLKVGEAARVEEYLQRYPKLAADNEGILELIAAEREQRRRQEPQLSNDEYRARFPQYSEEIVAWNAQPGASTSATLTCPACWSPIASRQDTSVEKVSCPSCGTTIRVDSEPFPQGPLPYQTRLGKYELLEVVGQGAFGVVYRARDATLQRIVAIKIPRLGTLASAEDVNRFLREARSAAQLHHPDIVTVHDAGQIGNTCYLASEFVQGVTLSERLKSGRLGFQESTNLLARMAEALHYAHQQGVVHRDLKPSNVLIDQASQPHLLDFGLARRLSDEIALTHTGDVLGTPAYMSPEQAEGEAHMVDGRSDIYSLGVIFYELLTGEIPFRGNVRMVMRQVLESDVRPPRKLHDGIPRDLETICLKAMAREPARRYQTAHELAEDLRRWQRREPIKARPANWAERIWRWCRRKPMVASLTAALTVVVIAGFGAVFWQWRRAEANLVEVSRQHDLAVKGLQHAREAVDQFHTRVSETKLLNEPGMQPLRRQLLQTARDFYEQFVQEYGQSPEMQADLSRAYFRLGNIIYQIGNGNEALSMMEHAVDINEKLLQANPSDPTLQMGLGQGLNNLANIRMALGDFAKAGAELEKSLTIFQDLDRAQPGVPKYEQALGMIHNNLGLVYAKKGQTTKAATAYQASLDVSQRLADAHPDHPEYQRDVARTSINLGDTYVLAGQSAKAETAYRRCVTVSEKLMHDHPKVAEYSYSVGGGYSSLAGLYSRKGKFAEADRDYQKALATLQQLVRANPTVTEYQRVLSRTYQAFGMMHQGAGRLDRAEVIYKEALAISEELARDNPQIYGFGSSAADTLNILGNLSADRGDYNAALNWYGRAVHLLETMRETHHELAEIKLGLSVVYANRALTWLSMDRCAEAGLDVDKAVAMGDLSAPQLFQFARAMIQARQDNRVALQNYQDLYAQAMTQATAITTTLLVPHAVANYYYAFVFALSSAAAANDQSLAPAERAKLEEQYGARAVQFLAKANVGNYFRYPGRIEHLKKDKELDPLREREDFKKLLAAVEADNKTSP